MLNFLTESIENATDADLVYLDFAKAFDLVPHNRLICKLHNYGISGNLLLWIRNFLPYRRRQVRVNDTSLDDINRLLEWSKKWSKKFNTSRCKVMHFGNDISNSYIMLDFNDQKRKKLEFITEEKDSESYN